MSEKLHFIHQFSPGERAALATNSDTWTEQDNPIGAAQLHPFKAALVRVP